MIEKLFGGDIFIAQTRALDAAAMRHQASAHNLANANTANYKRQEVAFEGRLSSALSRGKDINGRQIGESVASVRPQIVTINSTSTRPDGNNVDMEAENVNMAINTLKFETISQSIGGYFAALKSVINGR